MKIASPQAKVTCDPGSTAPSQWVWGLWANDCPGKIWAARLPPNFGMTVQPHFLSTSDFITDDASRLTGDSLMSTQLFLPLYRALAISSRIEPGLPTHDSGETSRLS